MDNNDCPNEEANLPAQSHSSLMDTYASQLNEAMAALIHSDHITAAKAAGWKAVDLSEKSDNLPFHSHTWALYSPDGEIVDYGGNEEDIWGKYLDTP